MALVTKDVIRMDWVQYATIVISVAGFFLWARTETKQDWLESREDWRQCNLKIDAIQAEVKDFHYQLLQIERNREERVRG